MKEKRTFYLTKTLWDTNKNKEDIDIAEIVVHHAYPEFDSFHICKTMSLRYHIFGHIKNQEFFIADVKKLIKDIKNLKKAYKRLDKKYRFLEIRSKINFPYTYNFEVNDIWSENAIDKINFKIRKTHIVDAKRHGWYSFPYALRLALQEKIKPEYDLIIREEGVFCVENNLSKKEELISISVQDKKRTVFCEILKSSNMFQEYSRKWKPSKKEPLSMEFTLEVPRRFLQE